MISFPQSPLSLWLAEYGPYKEEPPLEGDIHVDVAIVGGGFTGIATAHTLKKEQPALSVAVLEHETVGYGASGRNAAFSMTTINLGFSATAMLKGKQFVRDAHAYMERAVDELEKLIRSNALQCDYIRPGFLRVATSPSFVKKLRRELDLIHKLGIGGFEWLDRDAAREKVNSELYLGAMWEPRLGLLNPAMLVREEKRLALERGALVYEGTPVLEIRRGKQFTLKTPRGTVNAEKVVFATNTYSHLIPELRRKQVPVWSYMIATEPLSDRHFAEIRWQERNGIEDARNLLHYYRITPGNRLAMGGGLYGLTYGDNLDLDSSEDTWRYLEEYTRLLFPVLRDVKVTHRWGGALSVTLDMTPALGYLGDTRAVYSLGWMHGVSQCHQNAKTITDLLLERTTENTACPFVNRRVIGWPPEPLRSLMGRAILAYLKIEDWANERGMPRMRSAA